MGSISHGFSLFVGLQMENGSTEYSQMADDH